MPKTAAENETRIKGRVERVHFSSPAFTAGKLRSESGDIIQFAGRIFAQEDDRLVLCGKWTTHPKYGRQFQVASMEYDQDLDIEGLANYIAKHPDIKGIGPAKARAIAERFGRDFDRFLVEEPGTIAQAVHVPLETIELLRDTWVETRSVNQAMTTLSAFGLTHLQVTTLVKKFGNAAIGMLRSDPYAIVRLVPGFGFKRVDKIAREKMGAAKEHPGRIRACVIFCVEDALDSGDCWIDYEQLVDKANTLLVMDCLDSRDRIEKALDGLIDAGDLSCCTADNRFLVAMPEIRRMEEELAQVFKQGARPNPRFLELDDDAIRKTISSAASGLNRDQYRAVATALRHTISLVTGGAGSGKTFTISALVGICQEHNHSVILAAPTGKAAKRMEEVVGIDAMTIHRLLGYDGRSFERSAVRPIDTDILIVDEVSMVDVPLAWHLFRAIDLERTAVVLVGDHNQLPPVGPGNLLRDLIRSKVIPTVILEDVIRQAGTLKENSIAILKGEVRKTSEDVLDGRRAWYVIDQFTDPARAQDFVLELFDKILSERLGFNIINDVQVLTPTHKGPLGTCELNIKLQQLVQRKLWDVDVFPSQPGRRPDFLLHDKVMQTKNNYETGVMNGAVGTVVDVAEDGTLTINFEDTLVEVSNDSADLKNLQLAYALTIHKSQGSEFLCSIVIVHKSHSFMHHRNLLYTGVTRASKSAVIVGDRWGIANCAAKRQVDKRNTFLSILLGG
ncbi:MAG: AAA family ATPase [Armatimonadota bacterium]|jgi:exodeoxyribonuclease V alpha subunit|nr:AAA family ATPase [Armatimonadota bacterium]